MGGGGGKAPKAQPLEPIKSAEQAMSEASDSTVRAQQMRRGIAATFSRPTMGAGVAASPTAGQAAKLGG